MKKDMAIEIICFLFILLFVYAAGMKLRDVEEFVAQLSQSPLLMPFASWIAWFIPILELIVAGLLIIRRFRLIGLIASFTLMVMFTVYIIVIMNFATHVPCSCGGVLNDMGWGEHLVFNIAFVVLAVTGIILLTKQTGKKTAQQHAAAIA
jgi:uncharacterized membrane protein YphA (DoxX/SURF4 family)